MKKSFYYSMYIIAVVFLSSCSNESTEENLSIPPENLLSEISTDPLFKEFIIQESGHFDKILDPSRVLEITQNNNELSSSELSDLSNAMGYDNSEELIDFYEEQDKRIKNLISKYRLNSKNIVDLEAPIMEVFVSESFNVTTKSAGSTCQDRYNNCMTNAFAVAGLEHIACGLADVTVAVGLACHALVTTLHITANNECGYAKEDCEKNQTVIDHLG